MHTLYTELISQFVEMAFVCNILEHGSNRPVSRNARKRREGR